MKKAIVIGCHVNGLGVIRSLRRKDFYITAIHYNHLVDFAHTSKHVSETVKSPHPRTSEDSFINLLVNNASRWEGALILETNDDIAIALSKNKEKLQKYFKIPTPAWNVLRKLISKPETYAVAAECNVPYPKTLLPKSSDDLQSIQKEISYPCILKPFVGHLFFSDFRSKNFLINNFQELVATFDLCMKSGHEVMIQEIIPGPDSNIYQCMMYINSAGNIATAFHIRKIRQNPPRFGVARIAISENGIPELKEFTCRMLKRIGFTGIVHSEFKKDPRDNQFKLLEVNGRLARSNWLAAFCGVNFPWIAYLDLVEQKQVEVSDYKKDVYWIEIAKDISNSMFHHRKENLEVKDYLKPYLAKNKTFADLSTNDFRPFITRVGNLMLKVTLGR